MKLGRKRKYCPHFIQKHGDGSVAEIKLLSQFKLNRIEVYTWANSSPVGQARS